METSVFGRLLSSAIVAVLALSAADCASIYRSYRKKVEVLYQEGMGYYNRGQFREALEAFDELASIDPEYRDAARLKAITKNVIAAKVEQSYQGGVRFDQAKVPAQAVLLFRDAIRWNDDSNYKDASARIEKLLKEPAVKAVMKDYTTRAAGLYKNKQLIPARLILIEALKLDPDDDIAVSTKKKIDAELFQMADTAYHAGQDLSKKYVFVGAMNKFREAVNLYPEHKEAQVALRQVSTLIANDNYYNAGAAALTAGNPIDALASFSRIAGAHRDSGLQIQKCHTLIKTNMSTHFRQAVTLYEQQRLKESLFILRWILVVDPGHDEARKYSELAQKKLDTIEKLGTD